MSTQIYNLLFTCCLIIPIGLLSQSDGRTLYLLIVFAVYWITFCTLVIIFVPKVVTIYKDASGLIANRISDSKASASEIASRNLQGRNIKVHHYCHHLDSSSLTGIWENRTWHNNQFD
jgi:hypothetical protein